MPLEDVGRLIGHADSSASSSASSLECSWETDTSFNASSNDGLVASSTIRAGVRHPDGQVPRGWNANWLGNESVTDLHDCGGSRQMADIPRSTRGRSRIQTETEQVGQDPYYEETMFPLDDIPPGPL
ncbi:unnamed protein product [Protopolystoma xenopodis]|uniref:Uncharacterized protein n=1 Tax=Protopolystoma xenopodis TaxID=117903 RepID=A0A448XRR5_9PLAT|nr:unnamed protein product [Protopolystoma xenopodis]